MAGPKRVFYSEVSLFKDTVKFSSIQEKGKSKAQNTYVLCPTPDGSLLNLSSLSSTSTPAPEMRPIKDAFTKTPSYDDLRTSPPPLPKPFQFHPNSSNLTKASQSLKDAILSRDDRLSGSKEAAILSSDDSYRTKEAATSRVPRRKRRQPIVPSVRYSAGSPHSKSAQVVTSTKSLEATAPSSPPPHSVRSQKSERAKSSSFAQQTRKNFDSFRRPYSTGREAGKWKATRVNSLHV